MEMEMEMRARENIEIGQDITPPIHPLSFALHDSLLHSHCSACFSPLPSTTHQLQFPPSHHLPTLFYCSSQCYSTDSPLHFSSAEHHLLQSPPFSDTSDLRTALRLLHYHRHAFLSDDTHRIAGLLSNRDKFMTNHQDSIVYNDVVHRIRVGAKAMAAARARRHGDHELLLAKVSVCENSMENWEKLSSSSEIGTEIRGCENATGKRRKLIQDDEFGAETRVSAKPIAAENVMRDGDDGLLENGQKLTGEDEIFEKTTDGDGIIEENAVVTDEEVALCLVITNAVEVQNNEGRTLGIAIYGPTFSWINHSCSPNSCYRFTLSSPLSPPSSSSEMNLRIAPSSCNAPETPVLTLMSYFFSLCLFLLDEFSLAL